MTHHQEPPSKGTQLKYVSTFGVDSSQGTVGVMSRSTERELSRERPRGLQDIQPQDVVFKMSNEHNFACLHEATVLKSLTERVSSFCPHFLKFVEFIKLKTDVESPKKDEPFAIKRVFREVLMCNYVKGEPLNTKIHSMSDAQIVSISKQVLVAIRIAQKCAEFTHYDLHLGNIMVTAYNPRLVLCYKVNTNEPPVVVETHGVRAVIIDYGHSYVKDLQERPMYSPLSLTDTGYFSDRFDWLIDSRCFLVMLANKLRRLGKMHHLREKINAIFRNAPMCRQTGRDLFAEDIDIKKKTEAESVYGKTYWNERELPRLCMGATGHAAKELLPTISAFLPSHFSNNYISFLENIQALIVRPISHHWRDTIDAPKTLRMFLVEWIKIDKFMASASQALYIFKKIIGKCAEIMNKRGNITDLKIATYKSIHDDLDIKHAELYLVDFRNMYVSLISLSAVIEKSLSHHAEKRWHKKLRSNVRLPVKSVKDIFDKLFESACRDRTIRSHPMVVIDVPKRVYFRVH